MSDNVAIKEGARAYNFTVDKLRTAQQGSDEPVIWVPESTVQLGSLRASENGVYLARSEELYGFNEIVVSVTGAATIGDRAVFPDDSGQLHEENLPHDIVIFRPPKKLVYSDGEKINLGGIVVMAMDADGNVWTNARYPDGRIPLGELRMYPTHADSSQAKDKEYESADGAVTVSALTSYIVTDQWDHSPYVRTNQIGITSGSIYPEVYMGTPSAGQTIYATQYNGGIYVYGDYTGPIRQVYKLWYELAQSFFYYGNFTARDISPERFSGIGNTYADVALFLPVSSRDPLLYNPSEINIPLDMQQTVTLAWARYGDGAVLSTSFDITISDGFSGGSGKF